MPAEKSLAEVNQAFNQARSDRLNGALEAALSGKLTPPGAPAKKAAAIPPKAAVTPPASAPAASSSVPTSASPAPSAGSLDASGAAAAMNADPDPIAADADPLLEEGAGDPDPEAGPALAPELAELQAIATKKDLRALEKKLGLPEGHLGVNNSSYKAYRNRVDALEASESQLDANQKTLIERFGPTVGLVQHAQNGNLKAYAQLIERTTGVPIATFIQHFAKNLTPEQLRVAELEAENQRLKQPPQQQQGAAVTEAQGTARADAYIAQEAGQHPAFKLEGAQEGVRKIWLASYDKASNSFKLTPQAAAAQFVAAKRSAYEREQWILSGKKPPKAAATKALPRAGSSETQPRKQKQLSRQELIERGAAEWKRAKNRPQAK